MRVPESIMDYKVADLSLADWVGGKLPWLKKKCRV